MPGAAIAGKDERFLERNIELKDAFFPVDLIDLFAVRKDLWGQPESIPRASSASPSPSPFLPGFDPDAADSRLVEYQKLAKYRAVVNKENGEVLSVVTNQYKLITNEQAVELAEQAFQAVFSAIDTKKMRVFDLRQSSRRTICQVDLIHEEYRVAVWGHDIWVPFLRVTNSYNKTRALQFDLGFSREYCENGFIFEEDTFRVKYYHMEGAAKPVLAGTEKYGRLEEAQAAFVNYLHQLERIPFPHALIPALVAKVFDLDFSSDTIKQSERRERFSDRVEDLMRKYSSRIGENAYFAFNVVTDFASRPPDRVFVAPEFQFHLLQKKVGRWLPEFLKAVEAQDFALDDYVGDVIDISV